MIGQTIGGRYSIVRLLGEGGMGSVYEARHTGTERRVALKVITGDLTKHPVLVARFSREARAAGVIDSQHIAQILDVGEDDGRPFLVMEYLQGEDLQQLFERIGPLPPDLAVRVVAQACLGLAKAHASGIMHRDIKPGNIFVAERDGGECVVKLLDFGIAKLKMEEAQDISAAGLTGTGALIGTPLYMSPEQARGDKKIDFRTDIWSVGVVLYTALTGRTPHHDLDAIGALIIAINAERGRPIHDFAPWVDPGIVAIVDKALTIKAADRYQTADAMYQDLRALIRGGQSIDASTLVPLTAAERAFVALPATVRSSEIPSPSQPAISIAQPPRAGSQPAIVLTPPGAAAHTPANGSTLSSGETIVDVAASTERPHQSAPPPSRALTTGATSSSTLTPRPTDAPRPSRAPLFLAGIAVVALATAGIARFTGGVSASSPSIVTSAASATQATHETTPPTIDSAPSAVVVTPSGSITGPTPSASASASSAPPAPAPAIGSTRIPTGPIKRPGRMPGSHYDPTRQM